MDLVVNEWLPEFFKPDCEVENQRLLQEFISKFLRKNDTIYVRQPSEFLRKILRYQKDYQTNQKVYQNLRTFDALVLRDSNRTVFIDEDVVELPEEANQLLSVGNYASDTYLFEAAMFTTSKLIVTTDAKLVVQMKDNSTFKVVLLSDFLRTY